MKKRIGFALLAALALQINEVRSQDLWPTVTKEMKPWTRWWWMGSAVDKANLTRELDALQKVGFGGVEITPIYGAKGYEGRYVPFLSDTWLELLQHTVDRSNTLGTGVDINLGTGWPFGGPQIEPKDAATRVFLDEHIVKKGDKLQFPLKVSDSKQQFYHLQSLRAFDAAGNETNLDSYIQHNEGTWEAPGDVTVIALFSGRTRQQVKRAAPGGEGYTLDHLGKSSVQSYFDRFRHAFNNKQIGVRAFFNDSYEVYGANWTDEFLSSFEQLKGYKLQDHLWDLAGKSDNKDKQARVKSDYREIVDDLLTNNFLVPFTQFANHYGAISKNQAHGSPGNLIDLYASTDIAEVETFGSSKFSIPGLQRDSADVRNVDPDPMMLKFASSATHLSGKRLTSSETFTWLTEHFKTSLSQMKPEVEQLFLSGVNHVFYHGTTFSPQDVPYPGWLFYASVNFTTNNSFWDHLSGLNGYITRVQSVLQTTRPDNELMVYWPVYDIWNDASGLMLTLGVHHVDRWMHQSDFYKQSVLLQRRGYSFDFVSDKFIAQSAASDQGVRTAAGKNNYKAIYVPSAKYFSEVTMENLLRLASEGATVVFQTLPEDVPGFADYEIRKAKLQTLIDQLGFEQGNPHQYTSFGKGKVYLTTDVHSALETEKLYGERLARAGLQFVRRVANGETFYYVVNHGKNTVDDVLRLNTEGQKYTLLDPQTGESFNIPVDKRSIRVQIKPGYAWIIKVSDRAPALADVKYQDQLREELALTAPWQVSFISGGPQLPKKQTIQRLSSWTTWNEAAAKFAGTAAYENSFELQFNDTKSYLLQLGKVGESARVFVNGVEAGLVWAHPFELDISKYLKKGKNTLRVEVANLMANRIRDLDQRKVEWRNYHEINFVNIDYKNFDASDWKLMESGLLGPVKLFSF